MTVEGLLAHAKISPYTVPLNMDKLLRAWKLIASSADLSELEKIAAEKVKINGPILGAVGAPQGKVVLLFSNKISYAKARFTVAHELAHCCLHNKELENGYVHFSSGGFLQPEKEIEANIFARRLLMPKESINGTIEKIMSEPLIISMDGLIRRLAMEYEVEEEEIKNNEEIKNRLDKLNFSDKWQVTANATEGMATGENPG